MWRRGLTLILAFNLLTFVPLPLALCAIVAGLDGQCRCPMTMMQCEGTMKPAMPNSGRQISCRCIQSAAPAPEAVQNVTSPAPGLLSANFLSVTALHKPASPARFASVITAFDLAPPGGQARLCVFLI